MGGGGGGEEKEIDQKEEKGRTCPFMKALTLGLKTIY